MSGSVQLGLGLIGIGREWGHAPPEVPPERDVFRLLERAVELGIRYFDTAPSYGLSEQRFGAFLKSARPQGITVATKCGEHWDFAKSEAFEDHSFAALRRSVDRSLELLGRIDVLQLHKTTPEVMRRDDLPRAWEYARSLGVRVIGASIKDPASAALTLADPRYTLMQLPYNAQNPALGSVIDAATARGLDIAVNRPFGMGKMLYGDAPVTLEEAYRFVLARRFHGIVLTGTKSTTHLEENIAAFRAAQGRGA